MGLGPSTRKVTGRGFLPVPGTVEKEAQLRSLLCSSEHLQLGHKLLARNRVSISDPVSATRRRMYSLHDVHDRVSYSCMKGVLGQGGAVKEQKRVIY